MELDDFDDESDAFLSSVALEDCTPVNKSMAPSVNRMNVGPVNENGQLKTEEFDFDDGSDEFLATVEMDSKLAEVKPSCPEVQLPSEFPFPFEPYTIQTGFMNELYRCLELGKVGIFESPTGTGKSLSLICGALKWLKDFQERQKLELEVLLEGNGAGGARDGNKENQNDSKSTNSNEHDWISEFKVKQEEDDRTKKLREEQEQRIKREKRLTNLGKSRTVTKRKSNDKPYVGIHTLGQVVVREKLEDDFDVLMKSASADLQNAYKSEVEGQAGDTHDDDDDNLVLEEYHSDNDGNNNNSDDENEEESEGHCTKIYFCSRTHSQLSQFVREIIKSPYGDNTRVVSLGSRQNLCVNEAVRKLKSLSLMNDTCRDLQKNKSKTASKKDNSKKQKTGVGGGCPYYKADPIAEFRDRALVEVQDIEQLTGLGRRLKACPYFGTRLAVPDAEIVALPYNTLLHKSTREASGVKLKDNIVVIDEAHNLLETINNVYSTEVTGGQLVRAHCQLSQYEKKYRSRLKAQNLMYIKQILYILANLARCIGGRTDVPADKQTLENVESRLWTINDFLFHGQIDNVNMFKVLRYCQRSAIAKKLHGFVEKYQMEVTVPDTEKKEEETSRSGLSNFLKSITGKGDNSDKTELPPAPIENKPDVVLSSPLMHIEGFLQALTNADKDGRIVINRQALFSQCSIKFLLLNPAVHFTDVVRDARAVIVAGGTMQPISEFTDQLFYGAGVDPVRISHYSCGHVISANQLLPISVSAGPTGVELDFTYQNRTKPALLDELGRLVCNVANIVPGGLICFFPSYDYEKLVYNHWTINGTIAKLGCRKKVFREPKKAGQVDQVLSAYAAAIQKPVGGITGSVLFCVVGGKMSEGINFSDDLGRCVMMVGMPYPNIHSPELKEKMDYLNANFPKDTEGKLPGQVHYENLCMKAVNQSIGRAIRHRLDYATILLLDRRYSRPNTARKLPDWISQHLQKVDKFGRVFAAVSKFFNNKKPG